MHALPRIPLARPVLIRVLTTIQNSARYADQDILTFMGFCTTDEVAEHVWFCFAALPAPTRPAPSPPCRGPLPPLLRTEAEPMTFPPFTQQAVSDTASLLGTILPPRGSPQPDPILAAILRQCAAFDAREAAPEGAAALFAADEYDAATEALVATPCATRFGALVLLVHLRWWLEKEAEFAAGHQPSYRLAQARASDLTLFLGTNLPPVPCLPTSRPPRRDPREVRA